MLFLQMLGEILLLFLQILLLICIIMIFKYLYLIIKRLLLVRKIKKRLNKHNGSMSYFRNPVMSVFKHDGKVDFAISCQGENFHVSVITTPFRRVRYHFINNERLELIVERQGVYIINPNVAGGSATVDRRYTVRKYKITFEDSEAENNAQRYVIMHPAPVSVTKVDGTAFSAVYNNDILFSKIRTCGLKYFLEEKLIK